MIKLYNADCFDVMKTLPDNSVDCIITDPPYGINFTKKYKSGSKKLVQNDDGFSVMFFIDEILTEYKRILKDNSGIYIFTRFDVFPYWWIKIKNYFDAKNHIVWDKGGFGMGDLTGNYAYVYESLIFATKGKHILNGGRMSNVWRIKKCRQDFHETQKPVEIIDTILEKSTKENDVIFDPYSGSATTAISAIKNNRQFIGCEYNKECYDIAVKRIQDAGGNVIQQRLSSEAKVSTLPDGNVI